MFDSTNMMGVAAEAEDKPVYRALMAVKPAELTANAWAVKAGVARSIFNEIRRHGHPSRTTLEKLLGAINVSMVQFEASLDPVKTEVASAGQVGFREIESEYFGDKPLTMLPLYGSAMGGDYGSVDEHIELTELHLNEVLEYLARPRSLSNDKDAYALTIVGDSMAPRYKPGERVAVSPRASVGIGDDVIVQLRAVDGEDERVAMVLIKELCRRGGDYVELKQHNPPVTFRIPLARVAAMHKVKGHYL